MKHNEETFSLSKNALNWLNNKHNVVLEKQYWELLSKEEKLLFEKVRNETINQQKTITEFIDCRVFYETFCDLLPLAIVVYNEHGFIYHINEVVGKIFNIDISSFTGKNLYSLSFLTEKEIVRLNMENALALDTLCSFEKTVTYENDPQQRIFNVLKKGFVTKSNKKFLLTTFYDITEYTKKENLLHKKVAKLENQQENILRLSSLDPLTGAYNRSIMPKFFQMCFKEAQAKNFPFSILLLDVDYFKKINDTFGHLIGDKTLQNLVKILNSCVRESDKIIRFGGEEFLILLSRTGLKDSIKLAERIRQAVYENLKDPINNPISISIGVASYQGEKYPEEIIHRADKKLYQAKEEGRNKIIY